MTAASRSVQEIIWVVDDEEGAQKPVSAALQGAGYQVTLARNGAAALARVAEATPGLIISDVTMPEMDGLELLRRLRADPATRAIPVIMLAAHEAGEDVVACLYLGADDCLPKPVEMVELLARVRAKFERPPVPRELLPQDLQTGLLSERPFFGEVERELARTRRRRPGARGAGGGCLAYLELDEAPRRREPLGRRGRGEIARQVAALLQADAGPLEVAGRDTEGRFGLLLPKQSAGAAQRRLEQLSHRIAVHSFTAGGERIRLTPVIGRAPLSPEANAEQLREQALAALDGARRQLDRFPVECSAALAPRGKVTARGTGRSWVALGKAGLTRFQVLLTLLAGLVGPFLLYGAWRTTGLDLAGPICLAAGVVMFAARGRRPRTAVAGEGSVGLWSGARRRPLTQTCPNSSCRNDLDDFFTSTG